MVTTGYYLTSILIFPHISGSTSAPSESIHDMPPPFVGNEASFEVYSRASSSSSSCCGSSPNIVVIKLHTTVVIPNYDLYYSAPIDAFNPPYHALADGSLVATPFITDVRGANLLLVLLSAAATFFFINTFWAASFLRKGNIKNKTLLYFLLASQALGVAAMGSLLATYFDQFANCNMISSFVKICTGISHTLLMTGILGYKAYRCLNSSRFVLAVLSILRTSMVGLLVANVIKSRVPRRLSGSCFATGTTGIMPYIVIVQTAEAAFICACFIYAVRKHNMYQGRISVQTTSDVLKSLRPLGGLGDLDLDVAASQARGWWDYVPEVSQVQQGSQEPFANQTSPFHHSVVQFVGGKPPKSGNPSAGQLSRSVSRKTSTRTNTAPAISLRSPPLSLNIDRMNHALRKDMRTQNGYRPLSGASSVISRLSKYLSRMQSFRKMLTDELYYTAFITVTFLAMAIVALVGSRQRWFMTSLGWVCLDWIFISAFTMHSFSRVVRRHEREAILQSAAVWNPVYRAESRSRRVVPPRKNTDNPFSRADVTPKPQPPARLSDPFADFVPNTEFGSTNPDLLAEESARRSMPAISELTPLPRSRQGSSSSSSSSDSVFDVTSPEVDLTAVPLHGGEQYYKVENPFDSIYEAI